MNQRESSGLPLRAIVMVLLFLGIVFLLVGFQALGSGDDSASEQTTVATTTTTATPSPEAAPEGEAARPEVRVFNISDVAGAAEGVANRLRDDGWTVAETGNLTLEGVTATTVYFGEGEQEAADAVGRLLEAPVEPRSPALAEQPPGIIVAVTG